MNQENHMSLSEEKIIILDFGSQYTQLIARRVRELNVYCEIQPFNAPIVINSLLKGIVLSGSPSSVRDQHAPIPDLKSVKGKVPILGICYGAQYLSHSFGGEVAPSESREYGRASLEISDPNSKLLTGIANGSQVWMSHGDTIVKLPHGYQIIGNTKDVTIGAFEIQFHPEVYHTTEGLKILKNFVVGICGCQQNWTPESFIAETIRTLQETLGQDKVLLGLSGGVDSSVAAVLLNRAIGKRLTCIFVDNGLLRKDEYKKVLASYQHMGLNVQGVDASALFLDDLKNITDPEAKRKSIGKNFIIVFEKEAHKIEQVKWLAQGTIYPDVIESVSVKGPSATIKSHHNVGGLPEKMHLKVIEPLKLLFKDEVRRGLRP
jgi:GMP synthase (glutamine-hydrolysing)